MPSIRPGSTKAIREFGATPEIIARDIKYGQEAEELHTAMHEVIGHGSGKLSPRLKNGSEAELKEYFSTMEEARADLMSLWNAFDPKLTELGLVSNQDEVAKAMYDSAALVMLTQLRRIPHGDTIEEDHARNRALIANYIMDKTGAIRMFDRDGKTYVEVTDYKKMHEGVGELLAEIMRIKAEGDYNAIKALVDKYGVHFDPKVRDQVVARYKTLDLPTDWAGINPLLTAKVGKRRQGGSGEHQLSARSDAAVFDLWVDVRQRVESAVVIFMDAHSSRRVAWVGSPDTFKEKTYEDESSHESRRQEYCQAKGNTCTDDCSLCGDGGVPDLRHHLRPAGICDSQRLHGEHAARRRPCFRRPHVSRAENFVDAAYPLSPDPPRRHYRLLQARRTRIYIS